MSKSKSREPGDEEVKDDVEVEIIRSDPRNHDIFAGGRDPDERHTISDRTPADKGLFGAIIVTSNGLTVS